VRVAGIETASDQQYEFERGHQQPDDSTRPALPSAIIKNTERKKPTANAPDCDLLLKPTRDNDALLWAGRTKAMHR